MQKQNSKKSLLIIGALLVLGIGWYFYSSGTPTDTDPSLVAEGAAANTDLIGTRVLGLLNEINSLKIDTSFFKSEAYSSLVDHTVPIYEQNVGKSNPFAR